MEKKLLILILLSAVSFFNPLLMFSPQIQKLIFYLTFVIAAIYFFAKDSGRNLVSVFPYPVYIALLGTIILSAFMATFQHSQGILQSLIVVLAPLFGYATVFILLRGSLTVKDVIQSILFVCSLSILVYFANLATFPNTIFIKEIAEDLSRGILRLPIPFIELFVLIVFYGINQLILEDVDSKTKKRWAWIVVVFLFMIILSVVRQIILITFVFGLWFYFRKISAFKKILLCLSVVVVVVFVVPNIPMFQTMMELTQSQSDDNEDEDDIRIKAWEYYTVGNQSSDVSAILGNGLPALGISRWGRAVDRERYFTEMYPEDVGWAGFFWYYGGIATFILLVILIGVVAKRKNPDEQYLSYWFLFILLSSIASGPILYYYQIVSISVGLYLAYLPKDESNSSHNPNVQQLRRYPQLHR